jgi:probable rRNA maturation factor
VNVFLSDEQSVPVDLALIRHLAETILEIERFPPDSEITVMLVTDDDITRYNERFMDRTGPTDVLAFPLESLQPREVPDRSPADPPINLGDVIISPDYVRRQAMENGSEFGDEIALMVVHGVLHLMGWDHADDEQAEDMEARERTLLGTVGVTRP